MFSTEITVFLVNTMPPRIFRGDKTSHPRSAVMRPHVALMASAGQSPSLTNCESSFSVGRFPLP